jgi:solute carrier family 13 (sodium-dependent dicarboxylate transporter), member 2/3/5
MNMFLPSISISREQTKKIGLVLGPILFLVILFLPIDGTDNNSSISSETPATNTLSFSAKLVLATTFWMAAWWITEAIPIYVTALLPLILFPSLSITGLGQTAANYADRIIFLFLGGFILAKAVEKTQLHRRFALNMLKVFGTTPKYIVAAFMLVTGILSAWMSNTATTMLMLPIAAAVISQIGIGNEMSNNNNNNNRNNQEQNHKNYRDTEKYINKDTEKTDEEQNQQQSRFGLCLMLSIAYSASIGGMATLIGTPPNAIFASLSKSMLDIDISFGQWLLIGMPISGISLIVAWLYMVHIGVKITDIKSIGREKEIIKKKIKEIGKITKDEKIVAAIFIATATAWVTRGLLWGDFVPMVDDSTIAIAAAFSLFLIPSSSPSKSKAKAKSSLSSLPTSQSSSSLSSSSITDEKYSKDFTQNNNNNKNNTKLQEQKDKSSRILDWETAVTIPWGVLILIGGGLALAHAFTETGLDQWISSQLVFVENLHYILIVLVIVALGIFFSEIVSNTATAALLIPIAVSLASSISIDPLLLMVPLTIATSYGFIMPVGTPPNAIVFGSKYVTAPKMAKAGFPLDIIGIIMVTALTTIMVPWIFGG